MAYRAGRIAQFAPKINSVEGRSEGTRKRLGELLVENRLISTAQLEHALSVQSQCKKPLGEILVEGGCISEHALVQTLALQLGVRPWDLSKNPPSRSALLAVPGSICRRYQVLPLEIHGDLLTLAMRNPADIEAISVLRTSTGLRIEPVFASETRLVEHIEQTYHGDALIRAGQCVEDIVDEALMRIRVGSTTNLPCEETITEADSRPVVELVNQILADAIRARASDIHFEARSGRIDLRFRIDGELAKIRELPALLLPMIAVRIKIMASLDIVESRLPQDGRMSVIIDGRNVDIRVSVLPNYHGPRIALRILDKSAGIKRLDEVGLSNHNLALLRDCIERPYGLVLVTGPTGSGKTTTLYSALNELRRTSNNILTCEDPVEYDIDGISQSQVNEKIGLTFATQLRAILRQDPDIVLVGEIRDNETAETAVRAALTGHLVLSSVHCNDAVSAIPRLLDMGIDPYLLSTSLICVTAQRLLRCLCPQCKLLQSSNDGEQTNFRRLGLDLQQMWNPVGCDHCHGIGYSGRFAVHEVMPVTSEIANGIAIGLSVEKLRELAVGFGYTPMYLNALECIERGDTTFEEAKRSIAFDPSSNFCNQEIENRLAS